MKTCFYLFAIITLLIGCSINDFEDPDSQFEQANMMKPTIKVQVCHYDEKTDSYKTLYLPENAVRAHLKHGDVLGACNDFNCNQVCLFCDFIDLLDFDEPCAEVPFDGDFYCVTIDTMICADGSQAITGQAILWDRDKFRNESTFCGTDEENDNGAIAVYWEFGCDGSYFGQVSFFYDQDGDDVFEYDLFDLDNTLEAYQTALTCKAVIDELAIQLGYGNACEDDGSTADFQIQKMNVK